MPPDGITLDRDGCLWVAVPYYRYGETAGYLRIVEGGELRDRIDVAGYSAFACTLGGPDATTLFLCESTVLGRPAVPATGASAWSRSTSRAPALRREGGLSTRLAGGPRGGPRRW